MIKKAILPVAGMGTRFLPVTKSSPKEMLPIIDKPVIQLIVEEAVNSGIEEIILVTGKTKRAIEDYFDYDYELHSSLAKKNKSDELKVLKRLENLAKISYVRQAHPLGDGHAILCASHCIFPGEDFAVLFGDDIIEAKKPALSQLIDLYQEKKSTIIGVQEVDMNEIHNYGVVGSANINNDSCLVSALQEKPKKEKALSNLGIIGKYVCKYEVLDAILKGSSSQDGELRLIDGFMHLLKNEEEIYAKTISGLRFDTGSKIGWLKANIYYAMQDKNMKSELLSTDFLELIKS